MLFPLLPRALPLLPLPRTPLPRPMEDTIAVDIMSRNSCV